MQEQEDKMTSKLFGKRNGIDGGNGYAPEMYTQKEMKTVDKYINETFGECPTVFHEIVSPDIHVDICIIPPRCGQKLLHPCNHGDGRSQDECSPGT